MMRPVKNGVALKWTDVTLKRKVWPKKPGVAKKRTKFALKRLMWP